MNSLNLSSPKSNHKDDTTDWREILNINHQEISALAEEVGIDWNRAKPFVCFDGSWKNSLKAHLNDEDKGRISVGSFKLKNKVGNGSVLKIVFSTFRHGRVSRVWRYRSENPFNNIKTSQNTKLAYLRAEKEFSYKKESGERVLKDFLEKWNSTEVMLPSEKFWYFVKKKIASAVPELKLMTDHFGSFAPIPLQDIDGNIQNFQKLYTDGRKYTLANCTTKGLFYVLGDLHSESNENIFIAEGFATAVSIWKLTEKKCAVIMALNAGNLLNVVKNIITAYPKLSRKMIIAADNDFETKIGNTGILAALKTIQNFRIKMLYPKFSEGLKDVSDFNDLMILDPEEAKNQLCYKQNKYVVKRDTLDFQKQLLDFGPSINLSNAKVTLKTYINCAIRKTTKIEKVLDDLSTCKKMFITKEDLEKLYKNKKNYFKQMKLKTHTIQSGYHSLISDNVLVKHEKGYHVLSPDLYPRIKDNNGFNIVKAHMGAGKTEMILSPFMKDNEFAFCFVHRKAIATNISERLEVMDYQDMGFDEGLYGKKFTVCINSINHAKFNSGGVFFNSDVICIDEATKFFNHIFSDTIEIENRELLIETLFEILRTAKKVILFDADANETLVKILERIDPTKRILLVESMETVEKQPVELTSAEYAYDFVRTLVKEGKKVLVPCDSLKIAKVLKRKLKKKSKKVLLISSQTKNDQDVASFLKNPDLESVKYDAVLYTSSCDSALSITVNYFDEIVGIFQGIVDPLEIGQMMGRLRTAKRWTLGLTVLRPLLWQQAKMEILENTKSFFGIKKLGNYDFIAGLIHEQKQNLCIDLKNTLIAILEQKNHTVTIVEKEKDFSKKIRLEIQEGKKELKNEQTKLLLSSESLSDLELKELEIKFLKSNEDHAKILRHKIEKSLVKKDLTEDDILFYFKNKRGIELLEFALTDSNETFLTFEKNSSRLTDSVELRSKLKFIRSMYKTLWSCLGYFPSADETLYGVNECEKFLERILESSTEEISMWNSLGIGPQINVNNPPVDATKFVNSILKKLGFIVDKKAVGEKRLYKYFLTSDSVERILNIQKERTRAKISIADWDINPTFNEKKYELKNNIRSSWKNRFSNEDEPESALAA